MRSFQLSRAKQNWSVEKPRSDPLLAPHATLCWKGIGENWKCMNQEDRKLTCSVPGSGQNMQSCIHWGTPGMVRRLGAESGDSGLCCTCTAYFERWLTSLWVDSEDLDISNMLNLTALDIGVDSHGVICHLVVHNQHTREFISARNTQVQQKPESPTVTLT